MGWVRRRPLGLILVCCATVACTGCNCAWVRHGCIVRGDWSLEFNRVPWLNSRAQCHEEYAESCGECGPPCGPACGPGAPPADCGPPIDGPQPTSGEVPCASCGAGTRCRHALAARPAVEPVGYHNHPRFHPVPTQPVFSQRYAAGPSGAPGAMVPPENCSPMPPGDGPIAPPGTQAAPLPEEIPTPQPEPVAGRGRANTATQRQEASSRLPSWIFNPPTPQELESEQVGNATAKARWIRR